MYDAVIVGGGVAGLSAALMLGRGRRRVLVLDGGAPRNLPAEHAHGFLTRDGTPPLELLRIGRDQVRAYPNVEFEEAEAAAAEATAHGFRLTTTRGRTVEARRLLLASGVTDLPPEIPGLADLWGRGVYHCPYCHGWEVRDRPWGVLGDAPLLFDRVALYRGWTAGLVVLAHGASGLTPAERTRLAALGATLDERRIASIERAGADAVRVTFENGSSLVLGGFFVLPRQVQRSPLAEALGCAFDEFAPTASRYVQVDPATGETSVPGVSAAGDMTGPMHSLILAAASGARAAAHLNHALAMADADALLLAAARNH